MNEPSSGTPLPTNPAGASETGHPPEQAGTSGTPPGRVGEKSVADDAARVRAAQPEQDPTRDASGSERDTRELPEDEALAQKTAQQARGEPPPSSSKTPSGQ